MHRCIYVRANNNKNMNRIQQFDGIIRMNMPRSLVLYSLFVLLMISSMSANTRRIVGVVPFENTGGATQAWVQRGVDEVFNNKLSEISSVSVFEKETLNRVLSNLQIPHAGIVDARRAFSIGKDTGIEVLVLGSYQVNNDRLSLSMRLVSTYTGSPIYEESRDVRMEQIYEVCGNFVRQGLNIMQIPIEEEEDAMLNQPLTSSMKAFEAYCKAYDEIEKESPMESIAGYFQRALQLDPNFWEAQYNLGVIYYNFGLYDRAQRQFNEVIEKQGRFYKPYFGKGVINYLNKNYREAQRQLKKSVQLKSDHDRSYYYLGVVYSEMDSIKKSIDYLEKSIEYNPNYANAHYQLGLAQMKRGWFKKATTIFNVAIKLDPDFYLAHNALGEAYYALNLYEESTIEFNKAIKIKPNYATAYFNLGNATYKRGALEEIVDAFWSLLEGQYIEEEGTNGTNGSNGNSPLLGLEHLREKSRIEDSDNILRKMVNAYRTALQYDKRFYEASYNLGLTYENLSRPDSSEFFYQLAISQKSDLSQAHMRLGKIYEQQKKYNLALESFKRVVSIDPDYFVANPKLGEPYRYVNIIELVLKENQTRLDNDPQNREALSVVGKIYLSLGRFGQAEQYYEQLVAMNPDDSGAQRTLRKIRRQLRKL